jgi:mannosyl-3-phosphoglycerate phosphatase
MIFTDLDGTLLDRNTYGWEEALPALDLCIRLDIPVILVSSKTRAEMEVLRSKLSLSAPFISENGGGVFFPAETFGDPAHGATFNNGLWEWSLGYPYALLIKGLQEIRDELGWNIKGFSDMSIKEISDLTNLDQEASRLAAMREYDEPFILFGDDPPPDEAVLFKTVEQKGLKVVSGGRFYHLQGKNDKGLAMEKILSWYRQFHDKIVSIALGDSPNDFPMLERADYPVLVRSHDHFPALKKRIPRLRITSEVGPRGWNSAVLDILGKKEEADNV